MPPQCPPWGTPANRGRIVRIQSYFSEIQQHIKYELAKANQSIKLAVAWFTDPDLLAILCSRQEHGVKVEVVIIKDDINLKSGLDYDRIRLLGGTVKMVGENTRKNPLMHNKFCIIDGMTVITGSYNWTIFAQSNNENITIINNAEEIAKEFGMEFESLLHNRSNKIQSLIVNHPFDTDPPDTVPIPLGIEGQGDLMIPIFKKGTVIPCEKLVYIEPKRNQGGAFKITIFQGFSFNVRKNMPLMTVHGHHDFTPLLQQLRIRFTVDKNGILSCKVTDSATDMPIIISISYFGSLSIDEIRQLEQRNREEQGNCQPGGWTGL